MNDLGSLVGDLCCVFDPNDKDDMNHVLNIEGNAGFSEDDPLFNQKTIITLADQVERLERDKKRLIDVISQMLGKCYFCKHDPDENDCLDNCQFELEEVIG